jgi:hypothetical protein
MHDTSSPRIKKKLILCAYAIHRKKPGEKLRFKEILFFQLTEFKDEAAWKGFIADLRGEVFREKA